MSREIRAYSCVVPAGTTLVAPASFDLSFPPRQVDTLEIVVPPGPSGTVGFAVQNSNVTVIPYDSDEFLVMSNEKVSWPLDGYIDSGSWNLLAYNTGTLDHTIYVRFLLSLPGSNSIGGTVPLATSLIDSSAQAPFVTVATIGV